MADMLLDITLFDDLRSGDEGARKVVEAILDGKIKAAVSPATICELWQSDAIDRRTEIGFLSVLRFVEEAAPDIEIARTAGLWMSGSRDNSQADVGQRDGACVALAAATANSLAIPICTRDDEAFEGFDVEITVY